MTRADASMADPARMLSAVDEAHSVPPRPLPAPDPRFDEFWSVYPRKVGKIGAQRAWGRVIRKGGIPRLITAAAERFRDECRADRTEQKFIPHPASWLQNGRYGDESSQPTSTLPPPPAPLTIPAAEEVVQMNDEQLHAAVVRLAADRERPVTIARSIIMLIRGQKSTVSALEFPAIGADRARELATMIYAEYLQTPEWRARRKIMLGHANHRCQVCNGADRLHVHHRTYERRGTEYPADLIVLCESCHDLFHANGKLVKEPAP